MARGGHGLPKVSLRPAMPYPPTPCGRATPETALLSFQRWPAHRAGSLRLFSSPLDTPHRTPLYRGMQSNSSTSLGNKVGHVTSGGHVTRGPVIPASRDAEDVPVSRRRHLHIRIPLETLSVTLHFVNIGARRGES
jgi:hypothetical protein